MTWIEQIFFAAQSFVKKLAAIIPKWSKEIMPQIIKFTTQLKDVLQTLDDAINSDIADTIVKIIPTTYDDEALAWLRKILKQILPKVTKVEDCDGNLECMINVLIDSMKDDTPDVRNWKLQGIANAMLEAHDEGKLKARQYAAIATGYYTAKAENEID